MFNNKGNISGFDRIQEWEIKIENNRDIPISVEVLRNFNNSYWDIDNTVDNKGKFKKIDIDSVKYTIELPPQSKFILAYTLTQYEGERVVYDPEEVSYASLLEVFWVSHNPTQGMRQGNDTGTQYRSGIYTYGNEQMEMAKISAVRYQEALAKAGHGTITTEIVVAPEFFYAENHHQQYLAKTPRGYCGLGGVGLSY